MLITRDIQAIVVIAFWIIGALSPRSGLAAWETGYVLIDFGISLEDGQRELILDSSTTGQPIDGEILWQVDRGGCRIHQLVAGSQGERPEWVLLRDTGRFRGDPAHAAVASAQALAIAAEPGRRCEIGGKEGQFVSVSPSRSPSTKQPEQVAPLGTTVFLLRATAFLWPKHVSVKAGERVVWIYADGAQGQHTISSGTCDGPTCPESGKLFDSGLTLLKPGDRFEHTFTTPGQYPYHCDTHTAVMQGTITVRPNETRR